MLTLHTPSSAPLTAQQLQVAELLLNGSTVTAAAAQTGIHRSTIYTGAAITSSSSPPSMPPAAAASST